MIALSTIVIFFFVLVIFYPATAALWVGAGCIKKRRVLRDDPDGAQAVRIDAATDRQKNRFFIISIIIAFFVIAPFLALLMVL
jgi:hypothetical protein